MPWKKAFSDQESGTFKPQTGNCKLETKVTLKKNHPCGSRDFAVIRMGPEVVLRCTGCRSVVRMGRKAFDKAVKKRNSGVSIQDSE